MAAEKARKQQFSNERFAREHQETFSIYHPSAETFKLLRTGKVVELPTSEDRWHVHPINHPPVHPSQPSVCGYWDGAVHESNFKRATSTEIAHWERILAMPSALYWPKGQTTQLSVLLEKEEKVSVVDGVDEDDWWQEQTSVAESLEEDGSQSIPADEEDGGGEPMPVVDEYEPLPDDSKTPEEKSYELATSVHLRLVEWWKQRHQNEEPLNLRLFMNGRRCDGPYGRIFAGGRRLDFSHSGRQVQPHYPAPLIGPRFEDKCFTTHRGLFPMQSWLYYTPQIEATNPSIHNNGRSCPCGDCVETRKELPLADAIPVDTRYVSRWAYVMRGDELVIWNPRDVLGETIWTDGGLEPDAENTGPADVARDKYLFNRVAINPITKCWQVYKKPELVRQGSDSDKFYCKPKHLLLAFQRYWFETKFKRYDLERAVLKEKHRD